jgi:CRP/FNR family transcriptional regulator
MAIDSIDPLTDLHNISWLKILDKVGWDDLLAATQLRTYSSGEVIILEGDPSTTCYVIHKGWVKGVKLPSAGREQILTVLGPGQPTNVPAVFADEPSWATLIALERCELWAIKQSTLLTLLDRYSAMARLVIRALANRLLYTVSLIEDLSLRSVTARLAKLLLTQLGDSQQNILPRPRWATQAEIAARLGTVPNVAHRALRELVDEGLIQIDRQQIVILDRSGLMAKAQL